MVRQELANLNDMHWSHQNQRYWLMNEQLKPCQYFPKQIPKKKKYQEHKHLENSREERGSWLGLYNK